MNLILTSWFSTYFKWTLVIFYKKKVIRFAGLDDKSISLGVKEIKYKSKNDESKTYHFERDGFKDYYLSLVST